jgi:polysaccharide pyruvyl transferase WcaK-like protein
MNLGAGPLKLHLSQFFVRRALLAADYVSLRDEKSRALVNQIGFRGESRVYPDNVYGLEAIGVNECLIGRCAQRLVGLAPMPYPGSRSGLVSKERVIYDDFIRKLAVFASWLVDKSYGLSIFGSDFGVDPLAMVDLQMALSNHHGVTASQYSVNQSIKSVGELMGEISRMDYVITCRFHGVVFAHLLNKPVLAIAHHRKVVDLMADLELSRFCVNIDDFDLKRLASRFTLMVDNAEEIKSRMAASLARNRQKLRSQFDELFPSSVP